MVSAPRSTSPTTSSADEFTNETLIERLQTYVEAGEYEKAEALAQLADHLEECYLWDVTFEETTG